MMSNTKGGSHLATLIYLLVASLAIYVVIKIVPPYQEYYAMEDEASQQLHLSLINADDVILSDLNQKARDLELPINEGDISLTHSDDGRLSLSMHWVSVVDFGYGIKRDFPFDINMETMKKKE